MALTPAEASIQGLSIVIAGRFNPSIFSPAWLRLQGLIGSREADDAEVQFIVPPAASFSTEWLQLTVTEDTLSMGTASAQDYDRLRDAAIGVLTVLNQTPIIALGINREAHWEMPSNDAFHAVGDLLVPKTFWGKILALPGTQDLTIQGVRDDLWRGYIRVTVQPSARIPRAIYARVNDHIVLRRVDAQPTSRDDFVPDDFQSTEIEPSFQNIEAALEVLRDDWTRRTVASEAILSELMRLSSEAESMVEKT